MTTASEDKVFYTERRGAVIAGFMNRPRVHNALNSALRGALADFWAEVRDDETIRVAIITGAPGASFSAGRDLKETDTAYKSGSSGPDWELEGITGYPANHPTGKPIIAAVNGNCMGAGLKIAVDSDLRICSPTSTFASPQAKVGRATESPIYLRKIGIPSAVARDMVFTGMRLDSAQALQYGLVSRVVPQEELVEVAWSMAETIAQSSPTVINGLKRGIDADILDMPQKVAVPIWRSISGMFGDTADARVGADAFAGKKSADYATEK